MGWSVVCWSVALLACDGPTIELLAERPEAAPDASASEWRVDAGPVRSTHRPAPEDAVAPEEPESPPWPGADGGIDPGELADAGVLDDTPTTLQWVQLAPYPVARGAIGAAALGNLIFLVGGDLDYEGQTPSTSQRVFDPGRGTYFSRADAPDNHQWGPCVVVHDRYLYAFGGWSSGAGVTRRYDVTLDSWEYMAPNPAKQMWGSACALVDGVVYMISGATDDEGDKPTNKVSAYDIATNTWRAKTNYPASKVDLAGAAIGTRIYVVGRDDLLDIYDTTTDKWSKGPSIGRKAARAAAVAHKGLLYVFGGKASNAVNRYDPDTLTWTELLPMSQPRGNAAAVSLGNAIHLFGGFPTPVVATDLHEALLVP